jgi:hypothetical protein
VGDGSSSASRTRLVYSVDAAGTLEAIALEWKVKPLPPRGVQVKKLKVRPPKDMPSTGGYLFLLSDIENVITEQNEVNNFTSVALPD